MLHWFTKPLQSQTPAPATPMPPLLVTGRAMCCSVGHRAAAAGAAMNARLNHFRVSDFVDDQGQPLSAGMVHGLGAWGAERLAVLLRQVLDELLAPMRDSRQAPLNVLINGPEASRLGLPLQALQELLSDALAQYKMLGEATLLPHGQGGFAKTMHHAAQLLARTAHERPASQVLLIGLDSLLFAGSVEQFLAQGRLATLAMADGCIPAEGAAAVLLGRADLPGAHPSNAPGLLRIESAAAAEDDWRLEGETPQRAVGLTRAVREALAQAKVEMADLDFQLSGMTGEAWYAREAALMQSRCMTRKRHHFEHVMPAQFLGFCGGAAPVLSLAWMAEAMTRSDPALSPGRSALAHFADPCGARSALVLRQDKTSVSPGHSQHAHTAFKIGMLR